MFEALFQHSATFDPAGDLDAFLKQIPARWAVYLLSDENDRPVQLLCVKNLRASLKRRLGGEISAEPSKRVDYRQLVRKVSWRRVDSRFETDLVYLEAARQVFPQTYRGMVGFRHSWFIHVNPETAFPRYTKTNDLSIMSGMLIGPVEDKHAAARLMQIAEDSFDLCRYYNILIEAPRGKACAYKEMGKCPAPCDGSKSMETYREMVARSAATLVDPGPQVRELSKQMQKLAGELRFEEAGKVKARIDQLSEIGKGPFRFVRRLEDFRFVSLQRGPWEGTAKIFLITPSEVREVAGLIREPAQISDLLREILKLNQDSQSEVDEAAQERVAVVTHHLFSQKSIQGMFLRTDDLDDRSLLRGYKELMKQSGAEEEDEEGLVKELVNQETASGPL